MKLKFLTSLCWASSVMTFYKSLHSVWRKTFKSCIIFHLITLYTLLHLPCFSLKVLILLYQPPKLLPIDGLVKLREVGVGKLQVSWCLHLLPSVVCKETLA